MLVGPARGSSCGSLVCYLLGITDIDPIPHGLIFERFIDITRSDLPDIDIDFDPNHRNMVFDYLIDKYGAERVGRLGSVSRYKAKSAIGDTAMALKIPKWEAEQISDNIIKRGDGDDRANYCIVDTLNDTDIGKDLVSRYPKITLAGNLEDHAQHPGKHAAGVIITNEPITNYVARDNNKNTIQLDKYDCDTLNLMKVDALGLRTLSIISDCLDQIGWAKEQLLAHDTDYDPAYGLLRSRLYTGIFQFEGQALQNLCRKIKPDRFTDLVALTALARPGPLISGASYEWCARRNGKSYEVDLLANITNETYGLIIYQEQVIRIAREIGSMSWEDCTSLRKGMGKSLGIEYMDQFYAKFANGAKAKFNIDDEKIRSIWEMVNSSGAYSFNKSHSVAYALVSYWCMLLKAKFPLEFALAVLKYADANKPEQIKKYLRELDRAGYTFKLYDAERSQENWSVQDNELIGGLTNIIGVGPIRARKFIEQGPPYKLPDLVKTKFDDVFEMREKFADLLAHPRKYSIVSKLTEITNIDDEGNYVFIAKVVSYKIRSLNEPKFLVERGGMKVPNDRWLTMVLEDDTDIIPATISRYNFPAFGLPMTKQYKTGTWFLFRGKVMEDNRRVYIEKYKLLK
jgi:DNA-directed DNA polymerase III PolC